LALPVVAIIGRPNVGKSTLVNRLCGSREAIVHDQPGVTRDRTYQEGFWGDRTFRVVDTGGLVFDDDSEFLPEIREQAALALAEAVVAIFVVDGWPKPWWQFLWWTASRASPPLIPPSVNGCGTRPCPCSWR